MMRYQWLVFFELQDHVIYRHFGIFLQELQYAKSSVLTNAFEKRGCIHINQNLYKSGFISSFSMAESKKILFVCVENAGRSQMAEGFFRKYAPLGFEPESAGTQPTGMINPVAIQAMAELGIDIAVQTPKTITNSMIENATKIINMGCMDSQSCPALFVNDVTDWAIEEPKGKSLEDVRKIRDTIQKMVQELCKSLG
jgi:protein-tyrosine-phosphatase